MKILNTNQFEIHYQEGLEKFVDKSLSLFNSRKTMLKDLFGDEIENVDKLKASLFTNRQNFVDYVKEVSNGKTLPDWAMGCFYNGEIQMFIDSLDSKVHVLTHETVHLYIQNLIYKKYKLDRITWLDESYACFIDGHVEKRSIDELYNIAQQLKTLKDFNMNILNNKNKVVTQDYNGYDMFMLIGKYIFDNNWQKEYVQILTNNRQDMVEIGKTILSKAIEYIEKIYKEK